jgi:two-component system, cell cycle response regulator
MNAKPIKVLLLDDGCRDSRFLQRSIGDGRGFDCDLVKADKLKEVLLPAGQDNPHVILLRSGHSAAQLTAKLRRLREIASSVPVLVLPGSQERLSSAGSRPGGNGKGNGHPGLDGKKLARFLRCGLRQHQLHSELSWLALSDELTGLYNRRGFLLLGSERMKMASGLKKNLLLFFADLDNLKQINDQFGHEEGDRALVRTAEIFRKTFRDSDITARFGGDEFTALVIEEFGQSADSISRRLQRNMAELAAKENHYPLSLSVGMTRYVSESRASLKKLLAQADQALYRQKRANHAQAGGNSILTFPAKPRGSALGGFRAPEAPWPAGRKEKLRKSAAREA